MDSDEHSTPSPPPPTEPAPKLPPPLPARPSKPTSQPKPEDHFDADPDIDDDDISQQMTQSYSEISFKSGHSPENEVSLPLSLDASPLLEHIRQRPMTLPCEKNLPSSKPLAPLTLEGTVHVEGNMTHFVTEDLEHKIRLSSPVSKKDAPTGGSSSRICTPSPLYRQLLVPQISSITADNVDVYKNAVSKMSDAMDSNIKSMYTMMAKAEEVTQSMKIVEGHAIRIKEIKRLVDLFESFI
ncbi:BLOC-1-related complex subunit 6 isoform X2 [Anoplophora glabripennis]|uniref:BLOC-1-related complex subunit 6 isoform X2 n=1 Tax=Anoplophora glabripennis TaxID=217634 RepID=UPI000874B2F9|nr:BLOC-1-related complex subunit 6 isoform X2 [Anoplophora glabripennis]